MKILWAVCFFTADVIIGSAMVALLCVRDYTLPRTVQWMFPLKGKWLWRFLMYSTILAYAGLAPVSLMFLIHLLKAH